MHKFIMHLIICVEKIFELWKNQFYASQRANKSLCFGAFDNHPILTTCVSTNLWIVHYLGPPWAFLLMLNFISLTVKALKYKQIKYKETL